MPPASSYCLLKGPLGPGLGLTEPPNHHLEGYQIRLIKGEGRDHGVGRLSMLDWLPLPQRERGEENDFIFLIDLIF